MVYTLSFFVVSTILPVCVILFSLGLTIWGNVLYVLILLPVIFYVSYAKLHVYLRANPLSYSTCQEQKYKTVIGGGWSYFLKKKYATSCAFDWRSGYLGKNWWKSGSTIADVQKYLTKKSATLSSHPSVKTSTLGGWVFSNSHGSGGTLWKNQIGSVKIYDQELQLEKIVPSKTVFHFRKSMNEQRRYIIREVEIIPTENVQCFRHAFKMNSIDDAKHFLYRPSHLRLAQIGARGVLCILWEPFGNQPFVKNKFSRFGLWFQADVFSAWQGTQPVETKWFAWPVASQESWKAVVTLSAANDFSPAPFPLFAFFAFAYKNFEVFLDVSATPVLLWKVCARLQQVLSNRSRCELRCSDKLLLLDFACPISTSVQPIFECLKDFFGNIVVHLHKGKADVSTYPLQNGNDLLEK
jgi:hypothetical protein